MADLSVDELWPLGLSERELVILQLRMLDRTLDSIGADLGVTRERIRQISKKACERLKARVALDLTSSVEPLQQALTRVAVVSEVEVYARLRTTHHNRARLVLSVVGILPFTLWQSQVPGWWTDDPKRMERMLEPIIKSAPFPDVELDNRARAASISSSFPTASLLTLDRSPLRRHSAGPWWVRRSAANRDAAYLYLAEVGEPKSSDEIAALLSVEERPMREQLRRDPRFIQLRPAGTWALADWPQETSGYKTALDAVLGILEENGPMHFRDLAGRMQETYPVSASRIAQTVTSELLGRFPDGRIGFARDGARPQDESEPAIPESVAVSEDGGLIGIRLPVNHDLLRGSGVPMPRYVSWHLGLRQAPSMRRFSVLESQEMVTINKFLGGTSSSSLRKLAQGLGVLEGCVVVLLLNLDKSWAKLVHGCSVEHCPMRSRT